MTDRFAEAARELRSLVSNVNWGTITSEEAGRFAALLDEASAIEKDALRYRAMRVDPGLACCIFAESTNPDTYGKEMATPSRIGQYIDAAIDAAMKESK